MTGGPRVMTRAGGKDGGMGYNQGMGSTFRWDRQKTHTHLLDLCIVVGPCLSCLRLCRLLCPLRHYQILQSLR